MSDFRYDPVFDQWVCIAESRQERPVEFRQQSRRKPGLDCPFCPGNERQTPAALVQQDGPEGWLVRAFPNKYPAFAPGPDENRLAQESDGRQEVIVISPRHVVSLSELSAPELSACMDVFRQRIADYWADPVIRHVSLFMNCGPAAGASIEHAHFQLMGAPVCTRQVRDRVQRMRQQESGQYLWQTEIDKERAAGTRIVDEFGGFTVYCPWASRYTGQLRFTRQRCGSLRDLDSAQFAQLGESLCRWTGAMERVLENPAYNIVFYLPPSDMSDSPWFVDLIPRFPQFAGFELATDCWVNPLSPETAARLYRD